MARRESQKAKRGRSQNSTRSIESEVFTDSEAKNQLANQPKKTEKSKEKKLSKAAVKKQQRKIRLYGAKNGKKFPESELQIPMLNKAVIPGVKTKGGKKGKKFVDDNDSLKYNLLVKSINDKYDQKNESKLEKSKRLDEVRELRKRELERKDQLKTDNLERMKSEVRSKASLARSNRRKNAKKRKLEEPADHDTATQKRKKVSFA